MVLTATLEEQVLQGRSSANFKELKCKECGAVHEAKAVHVCEYCFGPLEVVYDYDAIRAQVSRETIANVRGQVQRSVATPVRKTLEEELTIADTRSYIVVTLIVGIEGKLSITSINNEGDLKQAIQLFGSISADQLLALEILWAPQSANEVLNADELIAQYPDLKLI